MPEIQLQKDQLDAFNRDFSHIKLKQPIFLNCLPKSGTHLLKNIFRMFVGKEQHYTKEFIQLANLRDNLDAFSMEDIKLSWGHLFFSGSSILMTSQVKHILLVRDPYDWVLAMVRFVLSDNFSAGINHYKDERYNVDYVINHCILGDQQNMVSLNGMYTHHIIGWLNGNIKLIKFEDLNKYANSVESKESQIYFTELFDFAGLGELPNDWQRRVALGANPRQSSTHRENLKGSNICKVPVELSGFQKKLVNFAAPGLREILGYA